jgi:NAD(P)-dependent dehydrogenase (short-subunit alcohol dehydrogenase family)
MSLEGAISKVWLITGASRGLGRAFTEQALEVGHRVLATARKSEHFVDVAFANKLARIESPRIDHHPRREWSMILEARQSAATIVT